MARGGRRNPALAPFVPSWVDLKPGGELRTLRQVEPRGASLALQGKALYCGFYVNELLVRLLHRDDAHPDLWPVYERTLAELAGDTPPGIVAHTTLALGVIAISPPTGSQVDPVVC